MFTSLILLLASLVSAQATPNSVQISNPIRDEITIVYPTINIYEIGYDFRLYYDVLDSNYTKLDNVSTSCDFYLMDQLGVLGYNSKLKYNNTIWYFDISSSVVDDVGIYNLYVYCNNTAEAGYVENAIYINQDGNSRDDYSGFVAIIIIIGLLMFYTLYLAFKINIKDNKDSIVPINSLIVMILFAISGFMAFMLSNLMLAYGEYFQLGDMILGLLKSIHMVNNNIAIIVMILFIFGIMINVGWSAISWLMRYFTK